MFPRANFKRKVKRRFKEGDTNKIMNEQLILERYRDDRKESERDDNESLQT